MARPPKGKPLTFRPIRLDDDVWAECQRLGKEHGTINEGMRLKLLPKVREMAAIIPPCAGPCEHISCEMQRLPSEPQRVIGSRKREPRAFKGPIQKPKDKKKG